MKIFVLKIRGGCDTYVKRDGTKGTAGKGALVAEDVAFTVAATQDQTLIAPIKNDQTPKLGKIGEPMYTLRHGGQGGSIDCIADMSNYVVRRLTPRECERLQGFQDDWTLIPYRGKPAEECPDGPRYKALGNSMAVPVMRWIGERILMVEEIKNEGTYTQNTITAP